MTVFLLLPMGAKCKYILYKDYAINDFYALLIFLYNAVSALELSFLFSCARSVHTCVIVIKSLLNLIYFWDSYAISTNHFLCFSCCCCFHGRESNIHTLQWSWPPHFMLFSDTKRLLYPIIFLCCSVYVQLVLIMFFPCFSFSWFCSSSPSFHYSAYVPVLVVRCLLF